MAIADKLNDLITQRNNLADNLNTMGVSANRNEKLSTLVPKVLNITSGGGTTVEKGIVINELDSDGYVTDVSVIGMTSIPNYAFGSTASAYNSLLTKKIVNVNLPNNLTSIGNYGFAFSDCLVLTSLPNTLTSVGEYAFRGCSKIALTSLPSGITSIGKFGFNGCTNLEITELPSGITKIPSACFSGCTKIKLTKLPDGIVSIEDYAFSSAYLIEIKEIPIGVTTIKNQAFRDCKAITELTFKGNVTSIATYSFDGCEKLEKVVLPNITSVPTLGSNGFTKTKIANGTGYIYFPDSLVEEVKNSTNWSAYADQIKGVSELV